MFRQRPGLFLAALAPLVPLAPPAAAAGQSDEGAGFAPVTDAVDQETGDVLWEINLGSPVSGFPITYAVDGRQYVAASTGARRSGLTPELRPSAGNNLFVFALPEQAD